MYDGHQLIYGYKLQYSDILDIFDFSDDEDDYYEVKESINMMLSDKLMEIEVYYLPCCYYDDNQIFLGFYIGSLSVQYRSEVESFKSMEKYINKYESMISSIKNKYNDSQNNMSDDIDKLFMEFPKIKDYTTKSEICLYTFATDCESCT